MSVTANLPLLELESDSGETFPVVDPATGETIAELPRMGAAETRRAIERAEAALPAWRSTLATGTTTASFLFHAIATWRR